MEILRGLIFKSDDIKKDLKTKQCSNFIEIFMSYFFKIMVMIKNGILLDKFGFFRFYFINFKTFRKLIV